VETEGTGSQEAVDLEAARRRKKAMGRKTGRTTPGRRAAT
jgi:hypothetical protein